MKAPDWTKSHARPNVAAGVLFTDELGRVLMVVPSYKSYLDIPGGYVEEGETPFQAAQREVFEELGIKPKIGRLLLSEWSGESPEIGGGSKLIFIFEGGVLRDADIANLKIDGDEITATQFCNLWELDDVTIPALANRLHMALEASSSDRFEYLEDGKSPPPQ